MLHTKTESAARTSQATPRWVKAFGIIALVIAVLLGIMLLSGGEHGPGRHMPSISATEVHTPPVEHSGQ